MPGGKPAPTEEGESIGGGNSVPKGREESVSEDEGESVLTEEG